MIMIICCFIDFAKLQVIVVILQLSDLMVVKEMPNATNTALAAQSHRIIAVIVGIEARTLADKSALQTWTNGWSIINS